MPSKYGHCTMFKLILIYTKIFPNFHLVWVNVLFLYHLKTIDSNSNNGHCISMSLTNFEIYIRSLVVIFIASIYHLSALGVCHVTTIGRVVYKKVFSVLDRVYYRGQGHNE